MTKLITLFLSFVFAAQTAPAPHDFARWEKDIAAMEAKDRAEAPPKGAILFIGSSGIVRWKTLAADFPEHKVINRGFGGSEICDSTHFADRLIFPHEPKMIVLRAGGNDIHNGKSPEQVFGDYKEFVAKVRTKLPDATIVYYGLCPAPARWDEREKDKQLNQLIEKYTKETPGLKYVEGYDLTITPEGDARGELFVADRLHLNAEGYKLMAERIRPMLSAESK